MAFFEREEWSPTVRASNVRLLFGLLTVFNAVFAWTWAITQHWFGSPFFTGDGEAASDLLAYNRYWAFCLSLALFTLELVVFFAWMYYRDWYKKAMQAENWRIKWFVYWMYLSLVGALLAEMANVEQLVTVLTMTQTLALMAPAFAVQENFFESRAKKLYTIATDYDWKLMAPFWLGFLLSLVYWVNILVHVSINVDQLSTAALVGIFLALVVFFFIVLAFYSYAADWGYLINYGNFDLCLFVSFFCLNSVMGWTAITFSQGM
jgi:hypothetical protein